MLAAGFVRDLMHEIGTGPAAIFWLLSSDPRSQAINKAGGVGCTVMSDAATVQWAGGGRVPGLRRQPLVLFDRWSTHRLWAQGHPRPDSCPPPPFAPFRALGLRHTTPPPRNPLAPDAVLISTFRGGFSHPKKNLHCPASVRAAPTSPSARCTAGSLTSLFYLYANCPCYSSEPCKVNCCCSSVCSLPSSRYVVEPRVLSPTWPLNS